MVSKPLQTTNFRKTEQFIAPLKKEAVEATNYEAYPSFNIGSGKINHGVKALAKWISSQKNVIIDGYVGVFWDNLVANLDAELLKLGYNANWISVDVALKSEEELNTMLDPYLGGTDPVFGKITDKNLIDWFHEEQLAQLQPKEEVKINIIFGCGAALAKWEAKIIYVDLPKNELQFRARAGFANNLGVNCPQDIKQMYKRFFFIDWVVLNHHKRILGPKIDIVVDEQRPDNYLFMTGEALREALSLMAKNVFRPRPWFEPGAWGGKWMLEHLEGVNKEVHNLAWSFELMVLENGILLESDGYLLEVSFDTLMFHNYQDVLGDCAAVFKYDFPIRFDFLDTFDGGNLSIQCHPSPAYIKEHFGMPFTQDETYYILDAKENASVYLGFQKGVQPNDFYQALVKSHENTQDLKIENYVQKFPAIKHDLFLIPHGTVHASGSNTMVLEISSAPYIFTFKMYDWLRLDLDGKPRPINIERGMANLDFSRNGAQVKPELIAVPSIISENTNFVLEHLPTHKNHFYDVHRYTLSTSLELETNNKCHVWMLVEGHSVIVESLNGVKQLFHYAETFVIPAAAGSYKIHKASKEENVRLVMSFVKTGISI